MCYIYFKIENRLSVQKPVSRKKKLHYPISNLFLIVLLYILKRKSFATKTKMLGPCFGPKQSLSGNAFDKSINLPCIEHKIRMVWLMVAEMQQ